MNLLLIFIVLNILNVIIQTYKSLITIKSGKLAAAIWNAIAYGFYTKKKKKKKWEKNKNLKP